MSLYEKIIGVVGRIDEVKSLVEGIDKFVNADNIADKTAAAGQLAAEAATVTMVMTCLRGISATTHLAAMQAMTRWKYWCADAI